VLAIVAGFGPVVAPLRDDEDRNGGHRKAKAHQRGGFRSNSCSLRGRETDSRTGFTDISDICTLQLPDLVVLLFGSNEQNLIGTAQIYPTIMRSPHALFRGLCRWEFPIPVGLSARGTGVQFTSFPHRCAASVTGRLQRRIGQKLPRHPIGNNPQFAPETIRVISYFASCRSTTSES
jgi:hypothetical protein